MQRIRHPSPAWALTLLLGCGARTPIGFESTAIGPADATPDIGSAPSAEAGPCGSGGTGRVVAAITVDPPSADHEPESSIALLWTGSDAFLAYNSYDRGGYHMRLASIRVDAGAVSVSSHSEVDVGNTSNPANVSIVWDGTALGRFWAQDDGSVVLQHFGADAMPLDTRRKVLGAGGQQTITSDVVMSGASYLLVWAVEGTSHYDNHIARLAYDGTVESGPTLLYVGSLYDIGARLSWAEGGLLALWSTYPRTWPTLPVTTTLASLDTSTGAVLSASPIDVGVNHAPTAFVTEPGRLDVSIWNAGKNDTTVLSRPAAGGSFQARAMFGPTDAATLATDDCGLVALIPNAGVGGDLPTALALRRVGEHGLADSPVALPLTDPEIESWAVLATPSGFLVAWIEFDRASSLPSRRLRAALVRL